MEPTTFFIALTVGAVLLLASVKLHERWEKQFRRNGIQTQGVVLKNQFCWGEMSVFRPVVQFRTQEGETIEALDENGLGLAVPRFSQGQTVRLIYEKANPRNFRITTNGRFV